MEHANNFSCYTDSEGRTGSGQLVSFSCRPEEIDQVNKLLKKIRTIDIPATRRVNVAHGGYGQYTRYDIKQHDYSGGGLGYIEVLEIKNPPDKRWGIVVNEYCDGDSVFSEWETLESARNAFENSFVNTKERFPTFAGFKRRVVCNALTPWFYAIGDEEIVGDYAFPEGLQDDPVYRFGKKFIFSNTDGTKTIKTCMGTRFLVEDGCDGYGRIKKYYHRFVYWSNGDVWMDEPLGGYSNPPRLLEDGEDWIVDAVKKFRELLSGIKDKIVVSFTTGDVFVGKIKPASKTSPEGRYDLRVTMKGGELLDGYVDFKPTLEFPDIVGRVTEVYAKQGKEVEKIEVVRVDVKQAGKKWAGVFYSRR